MARNKDKQKLKQKESYLRHKETVLNRNKTRRIERKQWFDSLIEDKQCIRCKCNSKPCLDFHHINPSEKHKEVSRMLNEFRSKESILLEIDKCVILCSNCHRELHAGLWCLQV